MFQKSSIEPRDVLVMIGSDGTAEIVSVIDRDHDRILAGEYSIPIGEAKAYTGRNGRIYVCPADVEYITDTKRIAALERSTVLRHITHFEKESQPVKLPMGKIAIAVVAVLILIIILAVK